MNKEIYPKIVERITLKVIQTGSDKTNFKILEMLPNNIDNIMKEFKLTKVPANVRVNKLEKVGLVKRWRGTGLVVLTDLGACFMSVIDKGKDMIRPILEKMIEEMI
jgi:hypothetical protein